MKKILFFLLFFSFSHTVSAELDIYLSSQKLPYGKDVWTSQSYPDAGSSKIRVERYFHREEIATEYQKTTQEISEAIDGVFSDLSLSERQARYESMIEFDDQRFLEYITLSLSDDILDNIQNKETLGYLLTPFESTFKACGINLAQRKTIIRTLLDRIYAGDFLSLDTLQYSNVRFGDCIIPFPDVSRGSTPRADSFPSNKIIAQFHGGDPLRFGVLEDSADLISLIDVNFEGAYTGVQNNKLLDLSSTRVEQRTDFAKQIGKNKMLFIHQNHTINLFQESVIEGNDTIGYEIGGVSFENHSLFINKNDIEEKRTFIPWQEIYPGVYTKTLIQENSFTKQGAIFVPNQTVGVTTYYAVLYNYDMSAPSCETTLFSHESLGNENFIFPEYPWFRSEKYGYFVCLDEESGCLCDTSIPGCFIRESRVFNTPEVLPHKAKVLYEFTNIAGLKQICQSPNNKKVFYDRSSPDISLTLPGYPEASLIREYVSNNGILYDGQQIAEKRLYHITNTLSFPANASLNMSLKITDPYENSKTQEGVSGISSYVLSVSEFQNENWVEKIQDTKTFPPYNSGATINISDQHTLDLASISGIADIFTKIGSYQVYLNSFDAAGNEVRLIFYFDIIAGDIDPTKSIVSTAVKDTLYADNTSSYLYTLTLRDSYLNPIVGKKLTSITHSCTGVAQCSELRTDMAGTTPSGNRSLKIQSFDTISDAGGMIRFSLSSLSPGIFTESFSVGFQDPVQSISFIGVQNTFLKPFQGILEVRAGTQWVSDRLPLDQESMFRVRVLDPITFGYPWTLGDFSSLLHARHPDTNFVLSGSLNHQADGVYFLGTFESYLSAEEKHKTLLEIGQSTLSGVQISYILAGETIRYLLSADAVSQGPLILTETRELASPVDIKGNLQGVGNTHNLNERQNTTDMNSTELRNMLRKNVEKNIKSRNTNTLIAGVKYVDKSNDLNKSYILESNPTFETLIVRNGNIHIQNDFNDAGKVIGIISYIDTGYNAQTDSQKVGNIYVEPEVKSIQAFIYADGGLISTQSGVPISGDLTLRNPLLPEQLSLIGALFTRNTLAGGRLLNGEYMLPGGQKTSNQSLAVLYDLYYTRRGNTNCEKDIYGFCNKPEYMILEHDPRISSTPPKLFSN